MIRAVQSRIWLIGAVLTLAPAAAQAGPPPGMPDPSSMSGIPRADPNIPAGTVTVRCLDGGFASPAIGIQVELEITSDAGTVTRTATTVEQGRATFTGLGELFGASAIAKATVAGQPMRSQAFVLGPQSGVALMLVATGSVAQAPAGPPHAMPGGPDGHGAEQAGDPHGGQGAMPVPGKPFPLEGRPPGTLVVGALDLGRDEHGNSQPDGLGIGPIPNVAVKLSATVPGVPDPIELSLATDADGRATFEGLDQSLPLGAAIIVEAVLHEGEEPTRSRSFTLGETALAVILARGVGSGDQSGPSGHGGPSGQGGQGGHAGQAGQAPPMPQRMQLPGPRADKALPAGQVRVFLLDGADGPVANQRVIVHSSQATGGSSDRVGTTDAQGMVIVDDVPGGQDTLAQVRVIYEGAPYSSTLFEMPSDTGAMVPMRVFKPTGDRTRVRSALQIDVIPRENDFASVTFNYAVFVEGDEAFWVPGGMRFFGPKGTRSFQVMREAEAYLVHDGETPWADLDRPIEPNVELRLSFAAGVEHDGSLVLDWTPPFPLVDNASVVVVPEQLRVTKGVAGAPEINPHAGADGGPIEIYKLGHERFEPGLCDMLARDGYPCPTLHWPGNDISIIVEDLPVRSRAWWIIGWALFGTTVLSIVAGVALRRRVEPREALLSRRDALMAELIALDEGELDTAEVRHARARMLRTLDRIYRQLEALTSA